MCCAPNVYMFVYILIATPIVPLRNRSNKKNQVMKNCWFPTNRRRLINQKQICLQLENIYDLLHIISQQVYQNIDHLEIWSNFVKKKKSLKSASLINAGVYVQ